MHHCDRRVCFAIVVSKLSLVLERYPLPACKYALSLRFRRLERRITGSYSANSRYAGGRKEFGKLKAGTSLKMEPETWNILQLGLSFFLIFSAFNTQGFIESCDNLCGVHVCKFCCCPGCDSSDSKMGLGGLCYATFMAGFLRPVGWFLYLSSAIMGFGAAIIWTGQGNYLTLNSNPETIGRNSGILWAIMQSCLVVGGIFLYFQFRGSESIQNSTVKIVYSVFLAVSGAGVICLSLLRRPPDRQHDKRLQTSRSSAGPSVNQSPQDLVEMKSISAVNPVEVVLSVDTLESGNEIPKLTIDEERKPDWKRDLGTFVPKRDKL